ncbi:MAG: response regulator [Rhodothermales bacterium]
MTYSTGEIHAIRGDILIVDDTLPNLRLLRAMLIKQGHKARGVPSGPMALEAAHAAPPDLILLDINMPEMSGYEVCRALKTNEQTVDIPVIFISAAHEVIDKVKAFSVGGIDYITKPFQLEEVLLRVENHLTIRHLQKRLKNANIALEQRVKERTAELQLSEERFAKIFHASPIAVSITTLDEGRFIESNERFFEILGYTRDELLGKTATEINLWPTPEQRNELLSHIMQKGGSLHDFELQFVAKSGEIRDLRGSVDTLELDGRMCLLWIGHDVTERKQVERDRERFFKELEARNAELERFAYTISHDLKNPLFTITGFLGLMEQDAVAGKTAHLERYTGEIKAATETINKLLNELLEISRIGRVANPPEEVSLAELVEETICLLDARITDRGIVVDIDPGLPVVFGDRRRLSEVLMFLLDNATRFMGDQPEPRIEIGARLGNAAPVFYIQDNGIGIEPRYHERVFRIFELLDTESGGAGVGLALAKRIVEVHGGRIWVESDGLGKGSTFCFTLPRKTTVEAETT